MQFTLFNRQFAVVPIHTSNIRLGNVCRQALSVRLHVIGAIMVVLEKRILGTLMWTSQPAWYFKLRLQTFPTESSNLLTYFLLGEFYKSLKNSIIGVLWSNDVLFLKKLLLKEGYRVFLLRLILSKETSAYRS